MDQADRRLTSPHRATRLRAAGCGAVIALALTSAATATPAGAASVLSMSGDAYTTEVAYDQAGNGHIAWAGSTTLSTAVVPAGTSEPSAARTLIALSPRDDFPTAAFGPDGRAVVALRRGAFPNTKVRASFERADGTMSPPVTISSPRYDAGLPVIRGDAAGNVVVAWAAKRRDGRWGVQYALRAAGGQFGPPRGVPGPGAPDGFQPEVAVSPGGRLVIAFEGTDQLRVATGTTRTGVGRLQTLGRFRPNYAPLDAAIDDEGRAAVVWTDVQYALTKGPTTVRVARSGPDGLFAPAAVLDHTAIGDAPPTVVVTTDGTTVVAWARRTQLRTVAAPAGRPVPPSTVVARVGSYVVDPALAAGPAGDTALTWTRDRDTPAGDGVLSVVQFSRRPAGGVFGVPTALSAPGEEALRPALARGPLGESLLAWIQTPSGGGNGNVQAAVVGPPAG